MKKITIILSLFSIFAQLTFGSNKNEDDLAISIDNEIIFSLISQGDTWQLRQYFLTRTQNGIEQRVEIESAFSDWEILDKNRVLVLTHQSKIQILDFTQPSVIQNVSLDVGSVDILEIATFEGGFYFVSAEAEHLAFTTDALWRYEWATEDYTSVAIPDSLNMKGLTCSRDGKQIAFEHTLSGPDGAYDEIYQLIHFDFASQNARILDQGLQTKTEQFVKDRAAGAIHFQGDDRLIYLKSTETEMNLYQINLLTQDKNLLSHLPFYVSSIALGAEGSYTYRSKSNQLVSGEWASGNFQKQAIPVETSVLGLRYY